MAFNVASPYFYDVKTFAEVTSLKYENSKTIIHVYSMHNNITVAT
jgi:hypothetical protein